MKPTLGKQFSHPFQDGATSLGDERILIVGATNRPQDLDEAARRRLVKRLYVPLPEQTAREHIVRTLMASQVKIFVFLLTLIKVDHSS